MYRKTVVHRITAFFRINTWPYYYTTRTLFHFFTTLKPRYVYPQPFSNRMAPTTGCDFINNNGLMCFARSRNRGDRGNHDRGRSRARLSRTLQQQQHTRPRAWRVLYALSTAMRRRRNDESFYLIFYLCLIIFSLPLKDKRKKTNEFSAVKQRKVIFIGSNKTYTNYSYTHTHTHVLAQIINFFRVKRPRI